MSRNAKICYAVLLSLLTVLALILLALCHIWAFLLGLLLVVTVLGLVLSRRRNWKSGDDAAKKVRLPSRTDTIRPRRPFSPHLILVCHNINRLHEVQINTPEFSLGRGAECSCPIPEMPELSRVHVVIHYDENSGTSWLVDQNSRNGTYLNAARLKPGERKQIANGDKIQLARAVFTAQYAHY